MTPTMTPYRHVVRTRQPGTTEREQLLALSANVEIRAAKALAEQTRSRLGRRKASTSQIWICVQHRDNITARTREVYRAFADLARQVHIVAAGLGPEQGLWPDNVILHDVAEDSPLAAEWNILMLSPEAGLALVSQELPPAPRPHDEGRGDGLDRRYAWAVSEQRTEVIRAITWLRDQLDLTLGGEA